MIAARSSNWEVYEIDGHDQSIIETLRSKALKPRLIDAQTIKGYGISFMENTVKWHSNWLNDEMETRAMGELS